MILLINVKITSYGLSHYDRAAWLPKSDRMDIFKYCLASYATMLPLISKCEFYIELAPEFINRRDELEEYIKSLYPETKLSLNWHRHYYSHQWRTWCDNTITDDNEPIWFAGNDDHIFIDSTLDVLSAGLDLLQNDRNPLSQLYYSHWPEQMRLAYHQKGTLSDDKNYIVRDWRTFDAITIMKGARWKQYWFGQDWGNLELYRTDPLWHAGYKLTGPVYVPTKELVRHYDGYSHVGDLSNITPPLFIPPGFFDSNMVIKIGFIERDNTCTNLNPASEWLYHFNKWGTDYRWLPNDLPLFWRNRIALIDMVEDADIKTLLQARNAAFISSTRIPLTTYSTKFDYSNSAPVDWFINHLN
jgi:hypothetical protein